MENSKINTNNSDDQNKVRDLEGPARTHATMSRLDFQDSHNVISGENYMNKAYGEAGVGWDIVPEPAAETADAIRDQEERKKFGHDIITVVVHPEGDRNYTEKFSDYTGAQSEEDYSDKKALEHV